jgi:hypothetical protein
MKYLNIINCKNKIMKPQFIKNGVLVFCFFVFSSLLNAQLKVESHGRVQVGPPYIYPGHPVDPDSVATMQIFGKNDPQYASGSKLTFGDFGRKIYYGWNKFIGEYGETSTDQLWLHGKNGIYLTYGNSDPAIAYFDVNVGNSFIFNCDVYSNGVKLTSDERLKTNIKPLTGALTSLLQLDGVSYNQNAPNPFSQSTQIKYYLPESVKTE